MLNPVHLRTLAAVLRTESFAAAANELGYTSSAVSQQMSALERDSNMALFERHARSIKPTPAASLLSQYAAEVLALLDGLEDQVRSIAGGTLGRLRIGSFPTASEHLLAKVVKEISYQLPGVSIELEEGEPDHLIPMVSDRLIDLALVYEYDLVPRAWPRNVQRTTVLSEDLVLMVPNEHDLVDAVGISDLHQATWISTAVGSSGAECLNRLCGAAGFIPKVDFRTNDYDVVRSLVAAGLGVALVPQLGAQAGPTTRLLSLLGMTPKRHIVAVRRRVGGAPVAGLALAALVRSIDHDQTLD